MSIGLIEASVVPLAFPKIQLSRESKDIFERIKRLDAKCFFKTDRILTTKLKNIEPLQLSQILNCLFFESIQQNSQFDPLRTLDLLSNIIPLDRIQKAIDGYKEEDLEEIKNEARYYLDAIANQSSPSLRARLYAILDALVSVIESIITAFGLGDFFKPAESDIHADFKSQKVMMLISLFSMITGMILPVLGAEKGALIIGKALLSIATASIIWPFIKPMVKSLPANAENWSKQIQQGGFVAQGRKESLDEIADILEMGRHPILVGPSRVGKSLAAKALVKAIERGDYPELKGKKVFRINTADIVGNKASFLGGGNDILKKISDAMGRHRKNIILVLDEIHMACKDKAKIADQLKTFLDEGGEFPHVIGITTEEEFKHVRQNNAFSLRFDRVDIKNTDKEETINILSDTVLKSRFKPLIEKDTLEYIYVRSQENAAAPQPTTAINILKRCINRAGKKQKTSNGKKIIANSNQISSLRSQLAASRGKNKEVRSNITILQNELVGFRKQSILDQKKMKDLFNSKELLDHMTKESYRSVLKVANIGKKVLVHKDEKQLKYFLLMQEFFNKTLEEHIKLTSKQLDVNIVIDKALVDDVLNG
ncbi:MAG: AAA family ATPase [Parachlamydiaceae bacterium]|nr:AAA family ATPase [Parachlamydiaceae bacterium]